MTGTVLTPTSPPTQLALQSLLGGQDALISWAGTDGSLWPIAGGLAPWPPVGEGVQVNDIKGFHAPFKHVDQTGAHQDGATWLDSVYDPLELDMTVTLFGRDAAGRRRVTRRWMAAWEPKKLGRLWHYTPEAGHWWLDARLLSAPADVMKLGSALSAQFNWATRADFPFWASFDSISTKLVASNATTLSPESGTATPNWFQLWNRGDQDGWPVMLLQGPGTFHLGDNGGPRTITLPLNAGELARVQTIPNQRTVTEVNTGANIYPRLVGRFSTPVPAGASVRIPVTVTGAQTGVTSAVASLTPWRRWPE